MNVVDEALVRFPHSDTKIRRRANFEDWFDKGRAIDKVCEVKVDDRDEFSMIKFNAKVGVAEMNVSNPTVRDTTLVFDAVGASEFPVSGLEKQAKKD